MNSKILLLAITAAALTSCSTAYKSGQTPDDVYYSPVRAVEENNNNDRKNDEAKKTESPEEREVRYGIRNRRWRDMDDDDYNYHNSPYGYCSCSCNNYGYYYNPYYSPWPVYNPKVSPAPVNSTPRMVNLNSYKGYSNATATNPKTGGNSGWVNPGSTYNNSNNQTGAGKLIRQIFTPSSNSNNNNNNSSNNNTRTYTPATNTNTNNNNSGSSSGSNNSSGSSVARPGRGGK